MSTRPTSTNAIQRGVSSSSDATGIADASSATSHAVQRTPVTAAAR
ncbi:hypothetical protein [Promicromonospora sp. NPDC057488]